MRIAQVRSCLLARVNKSPRIRECHSWKPQMPLTYRNNRLSRGSLGLGSDSCTAGRGGYPFMGPAGPEAGQVGVYWVVWGRGNVWNHPPSTPTHYPPLPRSITLLPILPNSCFKFHHEAQCNANNSSQFLTLIWYLLYIRYYSKHFACINSFNLN